jgi:hypothetical protein
MSFEVRRMSHQVKRGTKDDDRLLADLERMRAAKRSFGALMRD